VSDAVVVSLIGAVGAIIAALIAGFALVQTRATHQLINSRMTELLDLTKTAARAEGKAEGEQAQRDRPADSQP
jgi:hypothetical protein